jgi:hypothetical protein
MGCSSLRSIWIPSSVETISEGCFKNCANLSSLLFESGSALSILGDHAFEGCLSLRAFCIPPSVESVSPSCFIDCEDLCCIVLDAGSRRQDELVSALRSVCEVIVR